MIATPTTLADAITARLRADIARADMARPDRPDAPDAPLSPASPDWELLADFLSPMHGLRSLCEKHNLGPVELQAWLAQPATQQAIAAYRALTTTRLELIDHQAPLAVRATLHAIITTEPPDDPRLRTRHLETTRKAANTLDRLTKRGNAAAPIRSRRPEMTAPAVATPTDPPPSPAPPPTNATPHAPSQSISIRPGNQPLRPSTHAHPPAPTPPAPPTGCASQSAPPTAGDPIQIPPIPDYPSP